MPVLRRAQLVGGRPVSPLGFLRDLSPIRRLLFGLALAVVLALAFLFVRDLFTATARTEGRLATGQADAAIESGQDAAATIGQQAQTEAARDRSVADMQKEVNDADDASAAHAAGADWLCADFGICS
jgi:hypothetical protein